MSFLNGVVTGKTAQTGQRIVIAGPEKIGKTSLACDAPRSLLVPIEQGYANINSARLPHILTTWEQVEGLCIELIQGAKEGKIKPGASLVWDSATALERLIDDFTVRSDPAYKTGNPAKLNMATAHGGYGKSYGVSTNTFGRWTRYLDELALYGGINSIVTCHVFPSLVKDPIHGEFHTWDLLLHSPKNDKEYGKREFITQWADMIGFYHEPMYIMKPEEGQKMSRGISANQAHQLAVARSPAWVAGNRYGLTELIPIPNPTGQKPGTAWNQIADQIYKSCGIDVYNRG